MKDARFFYTGKGADERTEKFMRAAYGAPVMVVGGSLPPSFEETMHACALDAGLPEIRGFYGYDFAEHEFIRMFDADQGEPDCWPSRKMSDILDRREST